MKRVLALFVFGLLLVLAQAASVVEASTTFTVNQTADLDDANRFDNRCDTTLFNSGDQCSLRAAIQQANHTSGTDTITFVSSAVHGLTRVGDDDDAKRGDLDITSSINIEGHLPNTTIDGNGIDRVFDVLSGTVTMQNLIVRGGHTGAFGGGYQVGANANLTLTEVVVRNNHGQDNTGGIENFGTLTLNQVTITANTTGDNIAGLASGRSVQATSNLTIQNSTVFNNLGADAVLDDNASIVNSTIEGLAVPGFVSLRNVTVSSLSLCDPTGICGNAGATNLFNSIIVSCTGTFTSLGYNLVQNTSGCTLTGNQAGNLFNVNPQLGRLGNNGGPTMTRALGIGSPAIDGGNPSGCVFGNNVPLLQDQRGEPRPTDGDGDGTPRCDMGAFEVQ